MIDFLIIGGGIAGLSAGARLSEYGTVTVLEAEDALGYHASGRSAAMFASGYGLPPTVALNGSSADYMHNANGGYLSPRGFMLVAGHDERDRFEADVKDLNLSPIDTSDALNRVPVLNPKKLGFAGVDDSAQDIDTDRLLQDFAKAIRGNGGQVLTRNAVTSISHSGHWHVVAEDVFQARTLINAAGAWADVIARMAGIDTIGLTPCRRSMARLPAPGGNDVTGWPMVMGVGESWYAKPDAGKLLVSPADADPVEPHDAYADDMVLAEGLARYEEMVTEPVTRVETNWAGLRSFAPDKTLVLGPDPDHPDFVWCAGQGGYGFQTSPAASRLLADLVTGNQPELDPKIVSQLRPDRLR